VRAQNTGGGSFCETTLAFVAGFVDAPALIALTRLFTAT
jgi:uncharacterized membrane protein YoaK (UPF0700 family)